MANITVDLWPDNLENTDIVPPVTLLKLQATALGNKMKNLLEGHVTTQTYSEQPFGVAVTQFHHVFEIVAPALGGYKYPLLTVDHDISLYPLTVTAFDHQLKCNTDDEFLDTLKSIFAEGQTRRIISVLLAQSRA